MVVAHRRCQDKTHIVGVHGCVSTVVSLQDKVQIMGVHPCVPSLWDAAPQ